MQARNSYQWGLIFSMMLFVTPLSAQTNVSEGAIDKSKVCMVDNEYKGEQQLKIIIDEKVYYGCCEPCIELLLAAPPFRFAKDTLTNSTVCKADAFVMIKPGESSKVLYFESEESLQKFANTRN